MYKDQKSLKSFINNYHEINFEEANNNFISSLSNKCISGFEYENGKLLKKGGLYLCKIEKSWDIENDKFNICINNLPIISLYSKYLF